MHKNSDRERECIRTATERESALEQRQRECIRKATETQREHKKSDRDRERA